MSQNNEKQSDEKQTISPQPTQKVVKTENLPPQKKITSRLPKAESVNREGEEDGFIPPMAYQAQVLDGGYTRIEISAPPSKLGFIHKRLIEKLEGPLKLRYLRLTDRKRGQLPKPESYVAVELSKERVMQACDVCEQLFYHDGRHQLWVRGASEEQIVLDELGMIYIYPDDFLFRDCLESLGWIEATHESMASRDYVKVNFSIGADEEEQLLLQSLGMVRWEG